MSHALADTNGPHRCRILPRHKVTLRDSAVQIVGSLDDPSTVACELIREADVIRSIRLRCPCGQVIVVDCEYVDAAPNASGATSEGQS